ncbi:hypothetical protein [Aureimonas pseudogalii]|uniref:Uncharacterized protein n=1 Tax=Aureimonas pseudogalii TaxID=1744844 RepID=A0A7W6E9E8_9HYPH|nr:hypothetical protein [Aureimonas pseudogalii]MBB3997177.1 hypothetical protein [Aureimonas pseudogalii]
MASTTLSRRGFLGHSFGAYALATSAGGLTAGISMMQMTADRHGSLFAAWVQAAEDNDYPKGSAPADAADREARYQAATQAERQALTDLLRFKPLTLEENAARIAHLRRTSWNGCCADDWEIELLLDSLT